MALPDATIAAPVRPSRPLPAMVSLDKREGGRGMLVFLHVSSHTRDAQRTRGWGGGTHAGVCVWPVSVHVPSPATVHVWGRRGTRRGPRYVKEKILRKRAGPPGKSAACAVVSCALSSERDSGRASRAGAGGRSGEESGRGARRGDPGRAIPRRAAHTGAGHGAPRAPYRGRRGDDRDRAGGELCPDGDGERRDRRYGRQRPGARAAHLAPAPAPGHERSPVRAARPPPAHLRGPTR